MDSSITPNHTPSLNILLPTWKSSRNSSRSWWSMGFGDAHCRPDRCMWEWRCVLVSWRIMHSTGKIFSSLCIAKEKQQQQQQRHSSTVSENKHQHLITIDVMLYFYEVTLDVLKDAFYIKCIIIIIIIILCKWSCARKCYMFDTLKMKPWTDSLGNQNYFKMRKVINQQSEV